MTSILQLLFFLISFIPTILRPLYFPTHPLNFFGVYLIYTLYRKERSFTYLQAFICGVILDLMASSTPMGFWTFNTLLTLYGIGMCKHFFFADKIMTLPVLTFLYSQISTVLYFVASKLFGLKFHLSIHWLFSDLFFLPALDALFALAFFALPLYYLPKFGLRAKR